jgi:LAO/AO transport system kinase
MTGPTDRQPLDRRTLARALSRSANATVADILAHWQPPRRGLARRIGITGAPGTGKSTLISRLVRCRLAHADRLGVLAIDPSSPYSRGAILGDRIRMDDVADDDRLFIRSLASRGAHDGTSDNIADLLAVMDAHGFDEVILETVGVGQTEYAVRTLVDTVVLVLIPESGDQIQAMKAGLMEAADIFVVNKCDLPGAGRISSEVRAVLARVHRDDRWQRRVVETSAERASGFEALSAAIMEHQAWTMSRRSEQEVRAARAAHQIKELFSRRVGELVEGELAQRLDRPLPELYAEVLARLATERG